MRVRPFFRALPMALLAVNLQVAFQGTGALAGEPRPAAVLRDSWDRTLDLSRLKGLPVLILYEDRSSASQNRALKDELAALASGGAYKDRVALVAIADVEAYDFWPARSFVKESLQSESRRLQTNIYCDWNGTVRTLLGAPRGQSTVVLYGRTGAELFSFRGTVPRANREELIALIGKEVAS